MSALTSAVVYAANVNSFARRQHLFDIAAKPIDVDSNFLLYPAPLFLFDFRPKCNHLIYIRGIVMTSRKFHRNPFCILANRKKYRPFGTGRTEDGNGQGRNIMPPVQHVLRRHKKS